MGKIPARTRSRQAANGGLRYARVRESGAVVCRAGAAAAVDIGVVSILAVSGTLMDPVSPQVLAMIFGAAVAFALILDQVKRPVLAAFKIG